MLHHFTYKTLNILLVSSLLVACGGSNEIEHKFIEYTNSENIEGSVLNLDNAPTITVQSPSPQDYSSSLVSRASNSSPLTLASSLPTEQFFPVYGLIIKFKNPNSNSQVNISSKQAFSTSKFLSNGMSAGMSSVTNKHKLELSLNSIRFDESKVFDLTKLLTLSKAQSIAKEIKQSDPNIEYVDFKKRLYPAFIPNDPLYLSKLHHLKNEAPYGIRAESAWDFSSGSNVVVAVLDTGYRPHVDMSKKILPGYDFVSDAWTGNDGNGRDTNPIDPGDYNDTDLECPKQNSSWHGAMVSGVIAANLNNKIGVSGIAYNSKILPLRVLGRCGGFNTDIADAIIWASGKKFNNTTPVTPYPAKVINISINGGASSNGICDPIFKDAINTARTQGSVVVVAAGNNGQNVENFSPANCPDAITVAASNSDGTRSTYSNYGALIDISAPGSNILSTSNNGIKKPSTDSAYQTATGTSFSAAQVSAALALMFSANPRITGYEAELYIKQSTNAFASGGCAVPAGCGTGILDASKAVFTYNEGHVRNDFDNNGKSDFVLKKTNSNYDEIYIGKINGSTLTSSKAFNTNNKKSIVAVGDFNGDKKTDLLEAITTTGRLANFVYMTGNNVNTLRTVGGNQPVNSVVLGAADFNKDSRDDLILRTSTGDVLIALMPYSGTNLTYNNITNIPMEFEFKGIGDLDGDGLLEVFWQNPTTFSIQILTMEGTVIKTNFIDSAGDYTILGAGRFHSSNAYMRNSKYLLAKNNKGELYFLGYRGDHWGGQFDSPFTLTYPDRSPVILKSNMYMANIGDYDGNGFDDILWRQSNSTIAGVLALYAGNVTKISLSKFSPDLVVQNKN